MDIDLIARMFASLITALATGVLAFYAIQQHRREVTRRRREEAPNVVLTDLRGELDHDHDQVILVNMSAHSIWVQQTLLIDRLVPVRLGLPGSPLGGTSGLMRPGDWTAFNPAPITKVEDNGLGKVEHHAEEYRTEVLLTFLFTPTADHVHQKKWLVRRESGFLWTRPTEEDD